MNSERETSRRAETIRCSRGLSDRFAVTRATLDSNSSDGMERAFQGSGADRFGFAAANGAVLI